VSYDGALQEEAVPEKSAEVQRELTHSISMKRKRTLDLLLQNDENFEIKDALIKSFLLIFASEKSQHLLLNNDVLDTAFICLDKCNHLSTEIQINLAKLLSIVLKFPQVEAFLENESIISGMVSLIESKHIEIESNAVKACVYLT
jgi:hypothetical protein